MFNDDDRGDERDDDGRDDDHPNQRRLTRLTSSPPQSADHPSDDRDRLNEAWHAALIPEATSDPFGKRLRKLTTAPDDEPSPSSHGLNSALLRLVRGD
jgi:hypothetical protein